MRLNPGRRDSRLGSNHLPRAIMFNAFGVRTVIRAGQPPVRAAGWELGSSPTKNPVVLREFTAPCRTVEGTTGARQSIEFIGLSAGRRCGEIPPIAIS